MFPQLKCTLCVAFTSFCAVLFGWLSVYSLALRSSSFAPYAVHCTLLTWRRLAGRSAACGVNSLFSPIEANVFMSVFWMNLFLERPSIIIFCAFRSFPYDGPFAVFIFSFILKCCLFIATAQCYRSRAAFVNMSNQSLVLNKE